jgi:hypothetical protein
MTFLKIRLCFGILFEIPGMTSKNSCNPKMLFYEYSSSFLLLFCDSFHGVPRAGLLL